MPSDLSPIRSWPVGLLRSEGTFIKGDIMEQQDNQCNHYVFDQDIKAAMKREGEQHDGFRRCSNKIYKDGLCKFHYNRIAIRLVQ